MLQFYTKFVQKTIVLWNDLKYILYFCAMKEAAKDKNNKYVVWVHMAPYAARYLIDNFGVGDREWPELVDVHRDDAIMAFLSPHLNKSSHTYDHRKRIRIPQQGFRKSRVAIIISARRFTRAGWALSPTDEAALATLIEKRCRGMLLTFLSAHYMVSGDAAQSIRAFYRLFHQTEESWPYDSIRKIWNRKLDVLRKKSINGVIERQIKEIVLATLSENGTISEQGKDVYENS